MTKTYNDYHSENEALVQGMLDAISTNRDVNDIFDRGYLISFLAGAMIDIPELKERVEGRIIDTIKLKAASAA